MNKMTGIALGAAFISLASAGFHAAPAHHADTTASTVTDEAFGMTVRVPSGRQKAFPLRSARTPDRVVASDIAPTRDITMVTSQVGWGLSATNQVLRTTDGGERWTVASPVHRHVHVIVASFLGPTTGMVLGVPIATHTAIWAWTMTNSGVSWHTQALPITYPDIMVGANITWFAPSSVWVNLFQEVGTATGPGEVAYRSTFWHATNADRRLTRIARNVPSKEDDPFVQGLAFSSSKRGWMTVIPPQPNSPVLFSTSNAGAQWAPVRLPPIPPISLVGDAAVAAGPPIFASPQLGALLVTYVTAGSDKQSAHSRPVLYTTLNGGKTWQALVFYAYLGAPDTWLSAIQPTSLRWQHTANGWVVVVLDGEQHVIERFEM